MPEGPGSFATLKPAFRRCKDKYKDNNAQNVPLPGVSGVIPEKDLFQDANQFVSLRSF